MPTNKLNPDILLAAIEGFESQKRRIDTQIAELRQILTGTPAETAATPKVPKGKRRKMSAAARKRIGDAQRKRWAASKGQSESVSATVTAKPKRRLSAAGKAAIVAALKKRWAATRAAAVKPAKKAAVKKTTAKKAVKKTGGKAPRKKIAASAPEQTAPAGQ